MLRRRTIYLMIPLLALMALAVLNVSAQDQKSPEALEQRVKALEGRIATLERTLSQRLTTLERRVAQGGGNPLEGEAQAKYTEITRMVATGDTEKAKTAMADFMKKYGSTQTAQKARRLFQELQVVGKAAPESWGIEKWYQGENAIDLSSDKTTLVIFWEEWCPHCRREVPKIQKLYDSLKDDGLQVLGLTKITRSSTEEKVTEFISAQSIGYPVAKEDGTATSHFGVGGIPAAAVLKDGKVVWRGHPAQLNEAKLRGWL